MRPLADAWVQTFGFLAVVSGALAAYGHLASRPSPASAPAAAAASQARGGRVLVDARLARDADTSDLAAGLASAKKGDTVYVRAGVYRGSFRPPDGVRLVGLGAPGAVVLEGPEDKPALWGAPGLDVSSLTVRGGSPGLFAGSGARVSLESVSFETPFAGVVAVGAGTKVTLAGCRVQRAQKDGLQAQNGAALELDRSAVLGSGGCGVSLSQGSAARLRASTLSLNGYGVCADAASTVDLGDSDLNGNLRGKQAATQGAL